MPSPRVISSGVVSRRLPQQQSDNDEYPIRLTKYQEQFVNVLLGTKHSLAEEGSYFVTSNPTPGTALAAPVIASFSDTAALFLIYNNADINDPAAVSIYLGHVKLAFTVAPATATGTRYLVRLDQAIRTPTAGSTVLAGPGGTPGALMTGPIVAGRGSAAKIWSFTGGAQMTIPAVTTVGRTVALGGIDGIPIVGGERIIVFGASDLTSSGQQSASTPVVIPPGWSAAIHMWWPGNATTGASVEPELAWWER
jgi:hypothetical protein